MSTWTDISCVECGVLLRSDYGPTKPDAPPITCAACQREGYHRKHDDPPAGPRTDRGGRRWPS